MTKRVIQFGTSRFLQAHADLFIHEARVAGQDIGPITVVKTTRGTERSSRVSAFGDEAGYPVIIRGIIDNKTVDNTLVIKSIDSAMIADRDWQELMKLFANEAQLVISNVGESGYAVPSDDEIELPAGDEVPHGFLVEILQSEKRPASETVHEIPGDAAIKMRLTNLHSEEVIPGFASHGMKDAAIAYVATTLGNFKNPFLNHKLSDISQNHRLKIERRVVDFIAWIKTRNPTANVTKLLALSKA